MKTWVLLRGLMRERRHWGDFVPLLQRQFPNDRVVTVDWFGNGELYHQQSQLKIADMVLHLQTELKRQAAQAPFHVIALSLGAMVAIEWAHLSPNEIASATLINTSVRPYSAFYHRLRPQNYLQLMQLIALTPAQREAIILQLTSNRFTEATLKEWIEFQAQYPISPANILRQLWAAASYRAPTTQPAVPMQLLSSQLDRLVSNQCSHALAKHWNLPHFIHPNAGHDLALDDPEWLIRHLETAHRQRN